MKLLLVFVFLSFAGQASQTNQSAIYHHAITDKISSLDPHKTADIYSTLVQSLSYESLFEYEFNSIPLRLKPALAKSLIPASKLSSLAWNISLREDIHFQDDPCFVKTKGQGRLVNASDVVYSLERVAKKETMSPNYSHMEGVVKGAREFHDGTSPHIVGIKALDDHTFEIQFERPSPRFVYWLATSHFAIMPAECVNYYKDDIGQHAIGTGPFHIKKYSPTFVVAERNRSFRNETFKGPKLPLLDGIEIETIKEESPYWLKFLAGQLDGARIPSSILPVALTKDGHLNAELEKQGVQHFTGIRSDVTYFIWNLKQPNEANSSVWSRIPKLRQAVAAAINYKRFIDVAYGGAASRAYNILAPTLVDYVPSEELQPQATAESLLKEAGFAGGKGLPPLKYIDTNATNSRTNVEALSQDLKKVGITLEPSLLSWPDLNQKRLQGDFDLTLYGWTSDYPDVSNHLGILHSKAIAPNGVNFGGFHDERYDDLVDQIASMPAGKRRKALIKAALERVQKAQAVIPLAHRKGHLLYQTRVVNGGFVDDTLTGAFFKYRGLKTPLQHR